jgi:excisionase family DNA binding protein
MITYSTTEAAKILGVTQRSVVNYCQNGIIKAYRTSPTGDWRIRREDLLAYAKQIGLDPRLVT